MDSPTPLTRKFPPLLWFLAGLIGLFISIFLYKEAFPTAHLSFTLKRTEILPTLELKIKSLSPSLENCRSALTFSSEAMTQYYLELEVGQKKLEALQEAGLNVWFWEARWFKPEQQEEWQAALDPQGRWVGYSHEIEENRELPSLTEAEAKHLAESFLQKNILHHPFAELRFVETQSEVKPHRKDYTFTWERESLRVKEAPYRLYVTIHGSQIGDYSENLKIPELWSREYARKRELNELFQNAAQYACIPLFLLVILLAVFDIRNGTLSFSLKNAKIWIFFMVLGVLLQFLNQTQSDLFSYSTTDPWSSFWTEKILTAILGALTYGLLIGILFILASHFYSPSDSAQTPFRDSFDRSALQNPRLVQSIGIAILLAFAHMGYANGFYLLGRYYGVWCPIDLDYAQILEGPIPWIEGFMTGYSASWMEELLFRVLSVFALLRLTKNRWLSIIIPAVVWAFLHSNYPQSPGYIRGIELTIVGISYGWIMLRYGIVTTLISHFCYNCWQSLIPVLQMGGWSNWMGALLVGGWPFALFACGFRKIEPQKETITPPTPQAQTTSVLPIPTLFVGVNLTSRLSRFHALTLFLLGLTLYILSWRLLPPQNAFIEQGKIEISRETALAKASFILKSKGINPESYRSLIRAKSGNIPSDYLTEHLSLSALAESWFSNNEGMFYQIRFYRFGQKEEFQIKLNSQGELLEWNHLIPREAPAPSLEPQEAILIAEKYLQDEEKIDLSSWQRVTEDLIQQEKRRDWSFEWENKMKSIGEAPLRLSLQIRGNEPVLFNSWYKIPEQWIREQHKTTWYQILLQYSNTLTSILIGALYCFLFTIVLRKKIIPWRWTLILSLAPVFLWLLQTLNSIPWFYHGYQTHEPAHFFLFNKIGAWATTLIMTYFKSAFQIGTVLGLFRLYFGFRPKHLLCSLRNDSCETRNTRIAWVIFYIGLIQLIQSLQLYATGIIHPADATSISIPAVNSLIPWLESLRLGADSAYESLLSWATFIVLALWLRQRTPWALPIILFWMILIPGFEAKSLSEFLLRTLILKADHWILLLLIWKIWKFDWFLLFTAVTLSSWMSSGLDFWFKGGPYASQSYGVIAGSILLLGALCWTRRQWDRKSYSLSR